MIDLDVFTTGLQLLGSYYNRKLADEIIQLWYDYLKSRLTNDEFNEAVSYAILHQRFFPTASELVEFINGGKELQAYSEWQLILTAAAGRSIPELSQNAIACLRAIGNINAVGQANEYQRDNLQKQFVSLYIANKHSIDRKLITNILAPANNPNNPNPGFPQNI